MRVHIENHGICCTRYEHDCCVPPIRMNARRHPRPFARAGRKGSAINHANHTSRQRSSDRNPGGASPSTCQNSKRHRLIRMPLWRSRRSQEGSSALCSKPEAPRRTPAVQYYTSPKARRGASEGRARILPGRNKAKRGAPIVEGRSVVTHRAGTHHTDAQQYAPLPLAPLFTSIPTWQARSSGWLWRAVACFAL